MKRALINENKLAVIETRVSHKVMEILRETKIYEVYSYNTHMATVVCHEVYNYGIEWKYIPKSTYYSATTGRHMTKALDYINLHLSNMMREIGVKKVILSKKSFGYAFIRGEGTIEHK